MARILMADFYFRFRFVTREVFLRPGSTATPNASVYQNNFSKIIRQFLRKCMVTIRCRHGPHCLLGYIHTGLPYLLLMSPMKTQFKMDAVHGLFLLPILVAACGIFF